MYESICDNDRFDCLARVIEHGSELNDQLCFELFGRLDREEFEILVVLNILKGVAQYCNVLPGHDGKGRERICAWFEAKFGVVPALVQEVFSISAGANEVERVDAEAEEEAAPAEDENNAADASKTFVTTTPIVTTSPIASSNP